MIAAKYLPIPVCCEPIGWSIMCRMKNAIFSAMSAERDSRDAISWNCTRDHMCRPTSASSSVPSVPNTTRK